MNIEDKKKLVVEKLMGWHTFNCHSDQGDFWVWARKDSPLVIGKKEWSPQSERKWWDEIWEKMDKDWFLKYIWNLFDEVEGIFEIHTAKPEICWKALVETIKETVPA